MVDFVGDGQIEGIVYMNEKKNMMYISFYSDELETEGDFKGKRKFDEDLQFVVMWANNIVDLIDGRVNGVPIKKRERGADDVEGYLSCNKNRTLMYMGFFGSEVNEEGKYKGRRKFDDELRFVFGWTSVIRDMIEGRVKSMNFFKRKAR